MPLVLFVTRTGFCVPIGYTFCAHRVHCTAVPAYTGCRGSTDIISIMSNKFTSYSTGHTTVLVYLLGTLFVHIGYTTQLYQPIQGVEGVPIQSVLRVYRRTPFVHFSIASNKFTSFVPIGYTWSFCTHGVHFCTHGVHLSSHQKIPLYYTYKIPLDVYPWGTLFVHIGYTTQLYQPIQGVEGVPI